MIVVCAATIGATILFLAARYIFADAARKRLGDLGERINAGFTENAFSYMLFLRLVPAFPFFLVNLAPAFTSIPLRTFVLATLVGIIPGTFVFVNLGETLGRIESLRASCPGRHSARSPCSGVFALIPILVRKDKSRTGPKRRRWEEPPCSKVPRHAASRFHHSRLAAWRPFLIGVAVGLACLLVVGVAVAQPAGRRRLRRSAPRAT